MKDKVLVTGAGGFIGSHLCEGLAEKGYPVRALVRYNSQNLWGWLESSPYKGDIEVVAGDIRDRDSIRGAVKGVRSILHLSALIGIPYSYQAPDAYIDTNIKGTLNILQVAREVAIEKIVHTSTSEVYGTAQFVPITEEHPIRPQSPYAATKAAADFLAMSFYYAFNLPVAVIRPFNNYGPRQSARAIVPTIITQILAGKKKIKLGALSPTRGFIYVKDTVEGFIKILESKEAIGEVINIGTDQEISIRDLVSFIAKIMGVQIEIETAEERKRPPESEVERLLADTKKAKRILSWQATYTLEDGLRETIDWLKSHKEFYKSDIYNV